MCTGLQNQHGYDSTVEWATAMDVVALKEEMLCSADILDSFYKVFDIPVLFGPLNVTTSECLHS